MPADERRRLGVELEADYRAIAIDGLARFEREYSDAHRRQQAAAAEMTRLQAQRELDCNEYTRRRDPVLARLWDERPQEVDEITAELEAEAHSLRSSSVVIRAANRTEQWALKHQIFGPAIAGELVHEDAYRSRSPLDSEVVHLSNRGDVTARSRALLGLAEQVREWTRKGQFGSVDELRELVAKAYGQLPVVESEESLRARARHEAAREAVRA
jgi:hypothetical protein